LLVVISIVALLIAILLPALARSRAAARRAVCGSHLHQLGIASRLYLQENRGYFWRYFVSAPGGRAWWFGYEAGGPGTGTNRPLDKSRSVLAPYLATQSDAFQCPAFPYDSADYYPKFAARSASYGYNLTLGPIGGLPSGPLGSRVARLDEFAGRETRVFVFADGIHFDMNPGFNEGHYIQYTPGAGLPSGYAHFRHGEAAQYVLLDGHVEGQRLAGHAFRVIGGGAAGNLVADDGSNRVYGY
jgi:prepilin-type processing-associated H-X9-DG protein